MGVQFEARGRIQPPNHGQEKCTRCGGTHWLQDCLNRHDLRPKCGAAGTPDVGATVATCNKELKSNLVAARIAEQESGGSRGEAMIADKAIREGKGVVDLGCTDAMGGERALDIVARKNMEKYRDIRLREVNLEYQPFIQLR